MKPLNERQIEKLLSQQPPVEPPADLAERLKRDIPDLLPQIPVEPPAVDPGPRRRPQVMRPSWGNWLMAASLLAAIGVGSWTFFASRNLTSSSPAASQIAEASQAESSDAAAQTTPETTPSVDIQPDGSLPGGATQKSGATQKGFETQDDATQDDATATNEDAKATVRETLALRREMLRSRLASVDADGSGTTGLPEPTPSPAAPASATSDAAVVDDPAPVIDGLVASAPAPKAVVVEEIQIDLPADSAPVPRSSRASGSRSQQGSQQMAQQAPARPRHRIPVPTRSSLSPPPPPPEPRVPEAPRQENRSIDSGNARYKSLEAEAKKLEEELAELEHSEVTRKRLDDSFDITTHRSDAARRPVPPPVPPPLPPMIDTEVDARSTFGLDVDTGSYSQVRRQLQEGRWPKASGIRLEEMINYFDAADPAPTEGDFALVAEAAPSPFRTDTATYLLRLNVHAREIEAAHRPPALLTFVVDISGSMARIDRLELVKEALQLLIDQLRPDDRLALVVYGSRGRVLLEPSNNHQRIRQAIQALRPEGSTNVQEGLELGYELSARHRRPGAIHRVILCSDGVANVGATSPEGILETVQRYAAQGIELTTVGFGMGDYNDHLMEQLADKGNGRYAYIDQLDEARRLFEENLTGTLQTVAAEARAQVVFDPQYVTRYRLIGYENRAIADDAFRDDRTDGGEIGAGHTVTALYEVVLAQDLRPTDTLGTLYLRYASVAAGEMVELAHPVRGEDFAERWEQASASWRLSALVAEFGEGLRRGPEDHRISLDDLLRRGQKLSPEFLGDRDVAELISLIAKAADHQARSGS